ncbi:hypothetical protein RDV78_11285 [Bacillota bacterium LX-D]|nr:hypothetical protein [Bacillota bacterium LX-D]
MIVSFKRNIGLMDRLARLLIGGIFIFLGLSSLPANIILSGAEIFVGGLIVLEALIGY